LQIEKRRSKDDAIQAMNENLSGTASTIAIVTVVAVLVLGGVGLLLYRQIILPIAEMESKMTEIATSQDFSQRLPVQRMDEIGHSMQAFNIMVQKIQESTELVKQKTADIHALLHYVPQGILTIEANNRIHPEYSEFLETILNTHEIAGRSLMEVLFTGTDCNADQLSQIETVTSACIGEDEMNFGFNAHLLPSEITKTMFNGDAKILDLNWSPISDESGTTLRILLCVRDVTEMRALASEAQVQKRELSIIGEILSVQQEKFHEFAAGANHFIAENRELIERTPATCTFAERQPVISQMFRNMHTIKGNARTYGLLHLTHVVHETEQTYDSLRASEDTVWDRDYLLQQLDATQVALQEYVHINEVKLGRKGPGRRGDAENYLMVEKQHIADTLTLLDRADEASGAAQRDALRHIRYSLESMGTQSIEDVLASVLESLPALAKELGKEAPLTTLASNGILLRSQVTAMLKNVCMHLYRNAIDHGIESAADRVALGKTPAGNVHLSLNMQGEQLAIRLHDDGRGLAIAHIRRKAIERKLIAEDVELTDEQIAQMVLQAGFSTAEQVTEVSGRGVGMDAVKGFVEAFGGSLTLNLLDQSAGLDYRRFETMILLPGKFALAPALRLLRQSA
jgi:HAMP domain-containing protein/HPt (histidine-containing phosphotransfer) domain-containing protein